MYQLAEMLKKEKYEESVDQFRNYSRKTRGTVKVIPRAWWATVSQENFSCPEFRHVLQGFIKVRKTFTVQYTT